MAKRNNHPRPTLHSIHRPGKLPQPHKPTTTNLANRNTRLQHSSTDNRRLQTHKNQNKQTQQPNQHATRNTNQTTSPSAVFTNIQSARQTPYKRTLNNIQTHAKPHPTNATSQPETRTKPNPQTEPADSYSKKNSHNTHQQTGLRGPVVRCRVSRCKQRCLWI